MPLRVRADRFSEACQRHNQHGSSTSHFAWLAAVEIFLARVRISVVPLTSRFKSMTTDYVTPTEDTILRLGAPPFSLEEGIRQTVEWLDGRLADDS